MNIKVLLAAFYHLSLKLPSIFHANIIFLQGAWQSLQIENVA